MGIRGWLPCNLTLINTTWCKRKLQVVGFLVWLGWEVLQVGMQVDKVALMISWSPICFECFQATHVSFFPLSKSCLPNSCPFCPGGAIFHPRMHMSLESLAVGQMFSWWGPPWMIHATNSPWLVTITHHIQEKGETRREGPWKVGWLGSFGFLGSFGAMKLEGSVAEPTCEPDLEIWCKGWHSARLKMRPINSIHRLNSLDYKYWTHGNEKK